VCWKTPIPGLGWSSPVIVGSKVFLTTAVPQESDDEPHDLQLVCVDLTDGQIQFATTLFEQHGPVQMHKKNSHASPTPLVRDGRVYVHFGPQGTACTTLNGKPLWKQTLSYKPVHGNGGSPVLVGDTLVIACDGSDEQYVVGLDSANGEVRWKTARDTSPQKGFSFATPLVLPAAISGADRDQVICPGSDAVFAYDPATGETIWRFDYPGGYSVIPKPVFGNGLVYVCSGYDKPAVYAIKPDGSGNVTDTHLAWKLDRGAPNTPSLLLDGTELYLVTDRGVAACLNALTGEEHWRERLGGNFSASPLLANGLVYFQNETGEATVVQAGTEFMEISRNVLSDSERTFASYAVAPGTLLIRSETSLYAITAAN
jgi:outer membrane protein assembly factor BamB